MKLLVVVILALVSVSAHSQFLDYGKELEIISFGPNPFYCPPIKEQKKVSYALPAIYKKHDADCSKFINSKGQLGVHGKEIFDHIERIPNSQYFKKSFPGMKSICPKWASLSKEQKKYFWVWFFAAVAWKEATCRETEINRNATSGVAVGYLQLNEKKSARYWRGGDSGKSCAVTEVKSPLKNIRCGLEIFNEQLHGKEGLYEGNGQLGGKGSNSYWQDLRGSKPHTFTMVKEFPGCT